VEEDGIKLLMEQRSKVLEVMSDSANDRNKIMIETSTNFEKLDQNKQCKFNTSES
jgi:hypothetical protein